MASHVLILMENSGSQLELPLSLPYLGGSLAVFGDNFVRHKPRCVVSGEKPGMLPDSPRCTDNHCDPHDKHFPRSWCQKYRG